MERNLPHDKNAIAAVQSYSDCMQQLATLAPASGAGIIAGAALIGYWLYGLASPVLVGVWFTAIFSVCLKRVFVARHFVAQLNERYLRRWENKYAFLSGVTGLMWGLIAWIPLSGQYELRLLIIMESLFCVVLIGCNTLVTSTRALVAFSIAIAVPLGARTLTAVGSDLPVFFCTGMLVMAFMLVRAVKVQKQIVLESIRSRHESAILLQQQRVVFETASEGIAFVRPKPDYLVSCNKRFATMFGYTVDDMLGKPPWEWTPDWQTLQSLIDDATPRLTAGTSYRGDFQLKRADGTQFWCEVSGMAVNSEDLQAGTVWVVMDITEKRTADAALRVSERRFRQLVTLSSDLYWEQDANFRFTRFDGAASFISTLNTEKVIGKTRIEAALMRNATNQSVDWDAHLSTLHRHEPFRNLVYSVTGIDSERYWLSVNGNPIFDADGVFAGYQGTASDVTLRMEAEERFRYLAHHDPLTKLPNRRLLSDRLEQAVRSANRNGYRLAVLQIDLDGFKKVNDQFGHATGDLVLITVAARLQSSMRAADTVARMGGDEFVVLLPAISSAEDALAVADKLINMVIEPIPSEKVQHSVGCSIGIAIFPDHGDSAEALLHYADNAMYQSKSAGGRVTRLYNTQMEA